jgi:hypothetical protein
VNARSEIASPVGHYKPEVLVLAPDSGEDGNTLSLVSQMLELGIAFDLDENWRLPTAPPKDLSAYKACLFPDTAKARYDKDLNAFHRAGGFLPYFKYFPTDPSGAFAVDHCVNDFQYHGRDIFTFHMASMLVQADITCPHPDFGHALERRPHDSILADLRAQFFARMGQQLGKPWTIWKDPDYLYLYVNMIAATATGDVGWTKLLCSCLDSIAASCDTLLDPNKKISSQLDNLVEGYVLIFGALLMHAGKRFDDQSYSKAGAKLAQFWFDHNSPTGKVDFTRVIGGYRGEDVFALDGLYWLATVTGDERPAQFADKIFDEVSQACQREDGIWAHWVDRKGRRYPPWCRTTFWALLGMTFGLQAVGPNSKRGARLLKSIRKTYEGLARHQDATTGLWRNVTDEPFTRIESSGTSGYIWFYDQLREMGHADARHQEMIEKAFVGLKGLCYRQGVGAFCRGTDYGPPEYYRSRPLGFSPSSSVFCATVAERKGQSKT